MHHGADMTSIAQNQGAQNHGAASQWQREFRLSLHTGVAAYAAAEAQNGNGDPRAALSLIAEALGALHSPQHHLPKHEQEMVSAASAVTMWLVDGQRDTPLGASRLMQRVGRSVQLARLISQPLAYVAAPPDLLRRWRERARLFTQMGAELQDYARFDAAPGRYAPQALENTQKTVIRLAHALTVVK